MQITEIQNNKSVTLLKDLQTCSESAKGTARTGKKAITDGEL